MTFPNIVLSFFKLTFKFGKALPEAKHLFLDQDLYIKNSAQNNGKHVEFVGKLIDHKLFALEKYYTDWIYSFLPKIYSKDDLCHSVFGRSTQQNQLCRDFLLIDEVAKKQGNSFVFYTDSPVVALYLFRVIYEKNSFLLFFLVFFEVFFLFLKKNAVILKIFAFFIINKYKFRKKTKEFYRILLNKIEDGHAFKFVFTFVDKGLIREDIQFRDRYFPDLATALDSRKESIILFTYFSRDVKNISTFDYIKKTYPLVCSPDQVVSITSFLHLILSYFNLEFRIFRETVFSKNHLYKILFYKDLVSYVPNPILCTQNILEKMTNLGANIDCILNSFENLEYEKRLIVAAQKISDKSKLIGFFHSALFLNQPFNWLSELEIKNKIYPHKIVCNGKKVYDILNHYYSSKGDFNFCIGPTLRYKKPFEGVYKANNSKNILIVTNFEISETVEACRLCFNALKELSEKDLKITLRLHPFMLKERVQSLIEEQLGIEISVFNFNVVSAQRSIEDEILENQVVLVQGTSASIDAIRLGKQTICIGNMYSLTKIPIVDSLFNSFSPIIYSASELAEHLKRIFNLEENELETAEKIRIQWYKDFYLAPESVNLREAFFSC